MPYAPNSLIERERERERERFKPIPDFHRTFQSPTEDNSYLNWEQQKYTLHAQIYEIICRVLKVKDNLQLQVLDF